MSLHRPGPPPHWDPQGRRPRPLLCHLGHTTLDDGLELHVVVDVGAGGGGLHRLQPGLVHWGRGPGGCRVGVQPAGGPPPAPCHSPHSPKSTPTSQAAAWSSSCCRWLLSFFGDGHCSGRVGQGGGCSSCTGGGAFLPSDPQPAPGGSRWVSGSGLSDLYGALSSSVSPFGLFLFCFSHVSLLCVPPCLCL